MKASKDWVKVVYRESDDAVRCIQGTMNDTGNFLEISGDYKTVAVNKQNIISITASKQVGENGTSNKQ